jgi:hypothetical protein
MKRIAKVAVACIGVGAVMAFFFLVPIVPMTISTYELYSQHGWCIGSEVSPGPSSNIYTSPSYSVLNSGVVYVPTGGYLWWLPSPSHSSSLTCI